MKTPRYTKGFTLVEIMVSLSVFLIVMTISLGAILSVTDMNEKVRTRKVAMDNLNFALDSMSRTIRFGTRYHCGGGDVALTADCASGESSFSVRASNGTTVTYAFSGGSITRSVNAATPIAITSPEISINSVKFRVFGSATYASDASNLQPQVIMTVQGTVGSRVKTQSSFYIQTTVSQRKLDI
jgi:prepilin-type N-terminal cleavage/methylation domain-containing protein